MNKEYTGKILDIDNKVLIAEVFETNPEDSFFLQLTTSQFSTPPKEGDLIELVKNKDSFLGKVLEEKIFNIKGE